MRKKQNYVEKRFKTSNHELERLLPKWKNKTIISFMKKELWWLWKKKITKQFVELRAKSYIYLKDDWKENEKKKKLKSQQRFKSKKYNACTEEVKKIILSVNDDNRIQSIDSKV